MPLAQRSIIKCLAPFTVPPFCVILWKSTLEEILLIQASHLSDARILLIYLYFTLQLRHTPPPLYCPLLFRLSPSSSTVLLYTHASAWEWQLQAETDGGRIACCVMVVILDWSMRSISRVRCQSKKKTKTDDRCVSPTIVAALLSKCVDTCILDSCILCLDTLHFSTTNKDLYPFPRPEHSTVYIIHLVIQANLY